ncbi:hypothetical protein KKH13_05330 [Patescibacteria group bacterium]|nr:hypothetical protein [Patescibacteria group bacterium]
MDKNKLIQARKQIDNYLLKVDKEDKSRYQKLSGQYGDLEKKFENVLGMIKDNQTSGQLLGSFNELRKDMISAVASSKPDMSGVIGSIGRLENSLKSLVATQKPPEVDLSKPLLRLEKAIKASKPDSGGWEKMDELLEAIKNIKIETPVVEMPAEMPVRVIGMPPQKIPQPVTNININPLRGSVLTTAVTVADTATALPSSNQENRRSIMIFNNDSSATIFIGGSDVTAANGLPVLAQQYSPVIDAGVKMTVYGITSSGTANVRVIETSNEAIGG